MRIIMNLFVAIAAIVALFKWRYKILNAILAVGILKRLAVSIGMRIPSVREKVIPSLFNES